MTEVSEFYKQWQQQQAKNLADAKSKRDEFLAVLQKQGVTEITVNYSGYGDSGDIDDVSYIDGTLTTDQRKSISDLLWDFVSYQHPGFENNGGGQGTITWKIASNKIVIEHEANIIETEFSRDEI